MVSSTLASVLAAGRPHFNARVAEIRHRYPTFDTATFAGFLRSGLDPVANAVDAASSAHTAQVVTAAYDIALELVAQGLAGPAARLPWINRAWEQLAPRFAPLIAQAPTETLGALSNAVVQLSALPGVRVGEWLESMETLASHVDSLARLHALGQIAAWRAGMAHFRDGALRVADTLPEATALAAVGARADRNWREVRDALGANPWWSEPTTKTRTDGIEIGQFTGFGGSFVQPPQVRSGVDGFLVRAGERYSLLIADACGAVLLPATAQEFDAVRTPIHAAVSLQGSRLHIGPRLIELDLPAEGLQLTSNAHTVAISSPYTHSVRLLPLSA